MICSNPNGGSRPEDESQRTIDPEPQGRFLFATHVTIVCAIAAQRTTFPAPSNGAAVPVGEHHVRHRSLYIQRQQSREGQYHCEQDGKWNRAFLCHRPTLNPGSRSRSTRTHTIP